MKVFIYDRQDADAVSAIMKLTEQQLKPGMFVALTEAEFVAMRDSVMSIDVDDPPRSRPLK